MSTKTLASSGGAGEQTYAFYIRAIFTEYLSFVGQAINTVKLIPIHIPYTMTVDRIVVSVDNGSAGNLRVGIYRDNGGAPDGGALVVESAAVAVGAVNLKQEVAIANTSLSLGLYWLAINNDNGGFQANTPGADQVSLGSLFNRSYALAFGAFTNPCPVTIANSTVPVMWVRVLSVP